MENWNVKDAAKIGGVASSSGAPTEQSGVVNPMTMIPLDDSEYSPRMRTFEKYEKLNYISERVSAKMTWADKEPGKKPVYRLHHFSNDDQIIECGMRVFAGIHGRLKRRHVGELMLLAYNLKDRNNWKLFSEVDDDLVDLTRLMSFAEVTDNTNLRTSSSIRRMKIIGVEIDSDEGKRKVAIAILPFENFHPDEGTVDLIKVNLERNDMFKNTFYVFLYAGEAWDLGNNIKEFLYKIDISYAGLHPWTLFCRCMEVLNMTNVELLRVLNTPKFQDELTTIATIFQTLVDQGRPEFRNVELSSDQKVDQNALNIAQIANLGEGLMNPAKAFAGTAYQAITKSGKDSNPEKAARVIEKTRFALTLCVSPGERNPTTTLHRGFCSSSDTYIGIHRDQSNLKMKRGLRWSDGEDDASSSDDSSTLDTDTEDNNGGSKSTKGDASESSKLKPSQADSGKKKKKGIDFDALSRHGYKGGLSVLSVPPPKEPEQEQDWSWSKGKEKQTTDAEESFEDRQKTRAAIADGEQLVNVQTRKEKRSISFQQKEKRKRDLGQASRGKNYVEEEKRMLRDSGIYSGFDA
ncbi:hypothetical protein Salat_2242600 [Sesamum alatum]|uniref:Uncharacterized protein n=1 Tax=Sesamum alatum TaxID=300844 RepID=A0AAE1XUK0_9LAMI|nr:hypothetical protein Salat_2242600 [Sesamum alatum]